MRTVTFTSELPINISVVEEKYSAKYVGDFCLRDKRGNWHESTAAVFWQENPKPEHSHYFALLFSWDNSLMIADGSSAVAEPISAVVSASGQIVYSRHRHDFRWADDNSFAVDGGRDYLRLVGNYPDKSHFVTLRVYRDKIYVLSGADDEAEFEALIKS